MCKPVESPAALAVTTADCELSTAELDRWSNRLARMLLRLGAHPGARIAIAETPQLEAMVARVAITKTGATPVPLTTETTLARADFGITTKAGRDLITDPSRWLVLDDRSTLVAYLTGSDAPLTESELRPAARPQPVRQAS
ncbi:hypothetical protein D7D52_31635 [Nocardia yunnanensis]|uniref:AMP-dependent synthetase/ligase domain-containing protein n=1 Tax=Nocardia yunnanensis TaxID=2382165 RepID=A0A386ZK16_9NOCA|nr:AMP-binding protein [Nocardia yunnanensis]AYF77613.1 hypothetical protein D7D52_31635 [Nocardia yunnanensis]